MEVYNKVLIGKYYPNSNCDVENGNLLTILPLKIHKIKDHIDHKFSDLCDPKIKSVYGWVQNTQPVTLNEFVSKYSNRDLSEQEIENIKIMLNSIVKLPEDTTVKVRYAERGVLEKKMVLVVHKVFFYD